MNTGIKIAFFRIRDMCIMDMSNKSTLNTKMMKCFHLLSISNAFIDALVDKVHRNSALAQNPAELSAAQPEKERMKSKFQEE